MEKMQQDQDQIARKKHTRDFMRLAVSDLAAGIALTLWELEVLPIPPFSHGELLWVLGFAAILAGAHQLYWAEELREKLPDLEGWRQMVARIDTKFRGSPVLFPVFTVAFTMLEWAMKGTTYIPIVVVWIGFLELPPLSQLREMRRL